MIVTVPGAVPITGSYLPIMEGVKRVARFTDFGPFTITGHRDVVFSIDRGPQQPLIFRAMGFMAVRADKDVVIVVIRVRGNGGTNSHPSLV
jgi:hypothetical protein